MLPAHYPCLSLRRIVRRWPRVCRPTSRGGVRSPIERLQFDHQARPDSFDLFDPFINFRELFRNVVDSRGELKAIALAKTLEDMRRLGSEVLGRLTIDALALVATMVHPFFASVIAKASVDRIGQPLAGFLYPLASVERPALHRAAPLWIRSIGPTKPLLRV